MIKVDSLYNITKKGEVTTIIWCQIMFGKYNIFFWG